MEKEIRIFDTSNKVLKVPGITFELIDVATGTLVGKDLSRDLNPPHNEWGVKLKFNVSPGGPFQVYTHDPSHRYPGNVIESLEGAHTNRIDIDLRSIPVYASGQNPPPATAGVMDILNWIQEAPKWDESEKRAVRNLFLNYLKLLMDTNETPEDTGLAKVSENWGAAIDKLQIPLSGVRRVTVQVGASGPAE